MRYIVAIILDADCTQVGPYLCESDSLTTAERAASEANYVYGTCIVDTETKLVDFGWGFRAEIAL